ncbi:MAG: metallophosphoesterase [Bacilli bacterium]|nr:metallophosphoesterase [Bacilli bacterium]
MTREELNEEVQKEIEEDEKKKKWKNRIKFLVKLLVFLTIFFLCFYTYTTYISTVKIKVREYRITSNKIPSSFNSLKMIQFSDLHFGTTMFLEDLQKVKKLSNERKPDLVVFTGDLIHKKYTLTSEEQEKMIQELKDMTATLGKYAILGDEDNEELATIFNQSDFILLNNDYDILYQKDNNPILLIGLSAGKNMDMEKAYRYFHEENHLENIYTITLVHEPDEVDNILNNYQTDLFLAGHSHNGNIRIPFLKKALHKTSGAKKYDQDYYEIGQSELFISSGLGTKKGIRLFCRPSINFYRLSNSE